VAKVYGVVSDSRKFSQRWTFFIDKDGKIAYIDKQVKTGSHGADIVRKLDELGVSKK
jgi:peroxiredoxin Q/BCP